MKISLTLLVLLLAAAWAGRPVNGESFRRSKVHCCSKEMFSRQRIPDFRIKEYRYTSSNCTHRAVLVTLPAGMVCVDPEKKWFQDYLNRQKKPNSTSV